ncbi:MAG: hypothetical protein QG628_557 [Patescibacteria group bacterium]|nr:hypothetical protein [Patescibacteria group bacterium]
MKKHTFSKSKQKQLKIGTVIISIAIIGSILLVNSFAATNTASIQPENGTFSGPAKPAIATGASGGNAAQFSSNATSPIQRAMVNAPHWGATIKYYNDWSNSGLSYPQSYALHVQRVGKGKKPDILRTFDSSTTGVWTWSTLRGGPTGDSSPTVTGHDGASWHSFKPNTEVSSTGSQNAAWTKSIKTIPVDGKPKLITIYHEPENDPKGSDPDAWTLTWIKSQIEIGKAIKAANHPDVVYGPVFMSKYSVADLPATDQASTRRFIQIAEDNGLLDDMNAVYDFIGWDPYHEGYAFDPPKLGATREKISYWMDAAEAFTEAKFPGKKLAIGEPVLPVRLCSILYSYFIKLII